MPDVPDGYVLTADSGVDSGQVWAPGGSGTPPDAADVPFTPAGTISATDVQAAIEEVAAEAGGGGGGTGFIVPFISGHSNDDFATWRNSATNVVRFTFPVPPDWGGGDFTVKFMRVATVTTNTAVMRRSVYRFRNGSAFTTIASNTAMNFTPGDSNSHLTSFTIAAANFQADDTCRIDIDRLGSDGADTMVGDVNLDGLWVEYTRA